MSAEQIEKFAGEKAEKDCQIVARGQKNKVTYHSATALTESKLINSELKCH